MSACGILRAKGDGGGAVKSEQAQPLPPRPDNALESSISFTREPYQEYVARLQFALLDVKAIDAASLAQRTMTLYNWKIDQLL